MPTNRTIPMNQKPPRYEVTLHDSFTKELNEIVDYLTENASYKTASQLVDDIQYQVEFIRHHPLIFPAFAPVPNFRKMPIQNWQYVVFYKIDKKKRQIFLVDIGHTSRDIIAYMRGKNIPDFG